MKRILFTGAALAAILAAAPASAELKFKPGEDARFNWANFEELKKVELLDERDQARERVAENAREQAEMDRIGAMRGAAAFRV